MSWEGDEAGAVLERCKGRGLFAIMCGEGARLVFAEGKSDSWLDGDFAGRLGDVARRCRPSECSLFFY